MVSIGPKASHEGHVGMTETNGFVEMECKYILVPVERLTVRKGILSLFTGKIQRKAAEG